jgi:hypothetical protein
VVEPNGRTRFSDGAISQPTGSSLQKNQELKATPNKEDELIAALEKAVLDILNNPKSKPGERLAAVANGVRIVGIRHKIFGSDDTPDFFGGAGS